MPWILVVFEYRPKVVVEILKRHYPLLLKGIVHFCRSCACPKPVRLGLLISNVSTWMDKTQVGECSIVKLVESPSTKHLGAFEDLYL